MNLKILYEDQDLLVVDKARRNCCFSGGPRLRHGSGRTQINFLIDQLLEQFPDLKKVGEAPRHGIVHRLDKDTSGILLVAKTPEALKFFQKQFKNREVEKKYLALVIGALRDEKGVIHTLIGRGKSDPRKQRTWPLTESTTTGKREALTEYKVLERFAGYTLVEVQIKTGRRHQIRCHFAWLRHPVAGDTLYGFKDSPKPAGLPRQFLHASYLKIALPSGEKKEFTSGLPEDLQHIINNLGKI
jgi:23S rRNA pseudouridine1911/1915/1917 synthase